MSAAAGEAVAQATRAVAPVDFFEALAVRGEGGEGTLAGAHAVVTRGSGGALNSHDWCRTDDLAGTVTNGEGMSTHSWAERAAGRVAGREAYFSLAAFDPSKDLQRNRGREAQNAVAVQAFWLDVEGKPGKAGGGYDDTGAAFEAVRAFVKASGLQPNFLVATGGIYEGWQGGASGWHIYWLLDAPVPVGEWRARARALLSLCEKHGLAVDRAVTTNAAQIMRAPGSIHAGTGGETRADSVRLARYSLDEFDKAVDYDPTAVYARSGRAGGGVALSGLAGTVPAAALGAGAQINGDVVQVAPYSYMQAVRAGCAAMGRAIQGRGEGVEYDPWLLMLAAAKGAVEGEPFALEMSAGFDGFDEDGVRRKLASLNGGPPGCDRWAAALGKDGPCGTCALRAKGVTNPGAQLGRLVYTTMPLTSDAGVGDGPVAGASEVAAGVSDVPGYVRELNEHFAVVRIGMKVAVAKLDSREFDPMLVDTFKQLMKGQWGPLQVQGEGKVRRKPLSDTWLEHPQRRQYERVDFAPGESVPAGTLNLWRGFGVAAATGNVAPWLECLAGLVPDEALRAYVLNWLAWKVQNPGGVPGTVLIFKGAKGAGKNALMEPMLAIFGPAHSMLADEPERLAGRFNGHLQSMAFVVADEAVFAGDPRQTDRIKSRVTAHATSYERKGLDPVMGVNRAAYVMLTNHEHVWQATMDERRAVVVEVGTMLVGDRAFWTRYHEWLAAGGASALLAHLQGVDLSGFEVRDIPHTGALRRQIEMTALRDPVAAWWHTCLTEGEVSGPGPRVSLNEHEPTVIDARALRESFEQSAHRARSGWALAAKRLGQWVGPLGLRRIRPRVEGERVRQYELPSLFELRAAFTRATQVEFVEA